MFAAYCDESGDTKTHKVFAIAGYFGRNEVWLEIETKWEKALDSYGLKYFKASECEAGTGEFLKIRETPGLPGRPLTARDKDNLKKIKTVFCNIATSTNQVWGVGAGVLVKDFNGVLAENPKARIVLQSDPYFIAYQLVMTEFGTIINHINEHINLPHGSRAEMLAFVFDDTPEFSGKAKFMHDNFQEANPTASQCMASLTYADDQNVTVLQMADNLAYETMKMLLNNRYDPGRKERRAMTELKKNIKVIYALDKRSIEMIVEHNLSRASIKAAALRIGAAKTSERQGR